MPRSSVHKDVLAILDATAIAVTQKLNEEILAMMDDSSDSGLTESWISEEDSGSAMSISPISLMSPMLSLDSMSIDSDSNSTDTASTAEAVVAPYTRLLSVIQALHDEVKMTRILEHRQGPMPKISQLPLLQYFAEDRVSLFRKKVRVDPPIFDDILDEISDHAVFQNQSNNKQFPISVQLVIFLNHVGHYGNTSSPDDVAQWAGVSMGTVMNCTNRVMAALLARHNAFIYIPGVHSNNMHQARIFAESWTCCGWRNGNLYARPGIFGDGFYDRKSNFSLNCQVGGNDGCN